MQTFILTMPAIALYTVLTARPISDLAIAGSVLFGAALLATQLVALLQWHRRHTAQSRNILVTCSLVCLFMGARCICQAPIITQEPGYLLAAAYENGKYHKAVSVQSR
jgi:hypothetical protein